MRYKHILIPNKQKADYQRRSKVVYRVCVMWQPMGAELL